VFKLGGELERLEEIKERLERARSLVVRAASIISAVSETYGVSLEWLHREAMAVANDIDEVIDEIREEIEEEQAERLLGIPRILQKYIL